MRDITLALRQKHTIGKPARATDVAIGVNHDAVACKRLSVKCATVVDNVHAEVRCDLLLATQDLPSHKIDVARDKLLLLKGSRREGKVDLTYVALLNKGAVVPIPQPYIPICFDDKADENIKVTIREVDVYQRPLTTRGDLDYTLPLRTRVVVKLIDTSQLDSSRRPLELKV